MDSVAGWLQLRTPGLFWSSWKKEWYVADCGSNTFMKSSSPSAKASTSLSSLSMIAAVTPKGGLNFEVKLKSGELLYFRCYSKRELDDWCGVLNKGLNMSKFAANASSDLSGAAALKASNQDEESDDKVGQVKSMSREATSFNRESESNDSAGSSVALRKGVSTKTLLAKEGAPEEAFSPAKLKLMDSIKRNGRSAALSIDQNISKKESVLLDNTVFMGKARNFAVSTGKQFTASAKAKGVQFDSPATGGLENPDAENNSGVAAIRKAVLPSFLAEENVDPSRFVKSPEEKEKLCKVVEAALDDFLGGNLLKEVGSNSLVDLMYSVSVKKGEAVIAQGEPTSNMYVIQTGKFGIYTQDFANKPPEFVEEKHVGEIFGALSLLYNQPGPFTVKAMKDSTLWALPRKKFQDLSIQAAKKRAGRKVRLLEGVPLIADNLDKQVIVSLADALDSRVLEDGEVIVRAGDSLTHLIFIGEGTAIVLMGDSNIPLGELERGEVFGEWALLDIGATSDVTLVAKSQCTIVTLLISEVEEMIGPLRAYITKRWAEERGNEFFFNENENLESAGADSFMNRNPVSKAPMTLAFSDPKPAATSAALASESTATTTTTTTTETSAAPPPSKLSPEEEAKVVSSAIEKAKGRATAAATRKTKGAASKPVETATTTPAVEATPAPTTKPVEEPSNLPPKKISKGADEEDIDSDDSDFEEENLDMPFVKAPPLRPELTLNAITPCALLGRGNFGRVHLCRNEANHSELFALKVLSRHFIVTNFWEVLVENERNAMLELSSLTKSPFLLKLYHSYSDKKNVYLLLELCQGGDLYNLLRVTKGNRFNEEVAMFYMAGVTLGLEAMHSRTIIYRDLKPENLMLDAAGMVKIADFGLAKKTIRTYTVCGTPDYMAPEVLLSRGHAAAVDWWALGVLLFEMVGATTPFFGKEAKDVYDAVLEHKEEDDLKFPDSANFSNEAKSIIRKLLHPKKTKRLGVIHPGVEGVKRHVFFKNFDWEKLERLEMPPPLKPKFVDMTRYTTGNAPAGYDSKINQPPDDKSGWKLDF